MYNIGKTIVNLTQFHHFYGYKMVAVPFPVMGGKNGIVLPTLNIPKSHWAWGWFLIGVFHSMLDSVFLSRMMSSCILL
jgi:hypothetical protein